MASALGTINASAYWTPNGGAEAEIEHVRSWEKTGTADNPDYASAQTGGYKARVKGPRDESFSIECYRDLAFGAIGLEEQDIGTLRLEADDAKDITMVAVVIDEVSVTANPETGEPMGLTISGSRYDSALPV